MKFKLGYSEILFLEGRDGIVGIARPTSKRIYMALPNNEEVVIYPSKEYLIVFSVFENSEKGKRSIKCMYHLINELKSPLIVLPPNHPISKRLKMVVSINPQIRLNCNITPGTHPKQDLLCSTEELSGITIIGNENGEVEIRGNLNSVKIKKDKLWQYMK